MCELSTEVLRALTRCQAQSHYCHAMVQAQFELVSCSVYFHLTWVRKCAQLITEVITEVITEAQARQEATREGLLRRKPAKKTKEPQQIESICRIHATPEKMLGTVVFKASRVQAPQHAELSCLVKLL